jgi:hypothetical protein
MAEGNNERDDIEDGEACENDLCELHTELEEHEITGDQDLPAATGGVQE